MTSNRLWIRSDPGPLDVSSDFRQESAGKSQPTPDFQISLSMSGDLSDDNYSYHQREDAAYSCRMNYTELEYV